MKIIFSCHQSSAIIPTIHPSTKYCSYILKQTNDKHHLCFNGYTTIVKYLPVVIQIQETEERLFTTMYYCYPDVCILYFLNVATTC